MRAKKSVFKTIFSLFIWAVPQKRLPVPSKNYQIKPQTATNQPIFVALTARGKRRKNTVFAKDRCNKMSRIKSRGEWTRKMIGGYREAARIICRGKSLRRQNNRKRALENWIDSVLTSIQLARCRTGSPRPSKEASDWWRYFLLLY